MFSKTISTKFLLNLSLITFALQLSSASTSIKTAYSKTFLNLPSDPLNVTIAGLAPTGLTTQTQWALAIMRILGMLATIVVFVIQPIVDGLIYSTGIFPFQGRLLPFYTSDLPVGIEKLTRMLSAFYDTEKERSDNFSGRLILDRDNCVELIRCKLTGAAKRSRRVFAQYYTKYNILQSISPIPWTSPSQEDSIIETERQQATNACAPYRCNPIGFIFRFFIFLVDWNIIFKA